jgi:zinc protease
MPANGANPQVKVPEFWKKELANGAKVIGAKNTEIPTVTLSISIPGGHLASAKDLSKAGLADFFTAMMLEDTKTRTAEQLTTELQKLGSTINISSDVDEVTFSIQTLKKNLAPTLALLEERMFAPKFTTQSFDRLKKQTLQNFKNAKAQPATVANAVFAKLNYGPNHILGISQSGTEETIGNLKLEDIESYYNNYMTSIGAKVVIVGDITQQEILPMLSFLDKLPKKKITLTVPEPGKAIDKTKVFMVDVPKGAQTEFRVGYATGMKYDVTGEYYKSVLSNFTIGGGFNSRLNQSLREQKGWTYGASSRFNGDEYSGDFLFSSGVKGDVTDSALAEVMSQIKNFVANGPTEDEMAFMKNAIGQSDALRYETGMQKAQFIRRILDYNLPANYTAEQAKILKGITREDIIANARKNMNPEKFNILLVGDKQKIIDGVKKLGYEIVEVDADGNVIDKKAF